MLRINMIGIMLFLSTFNIYPMMNFTLPDTKNPPCDRQCDNIAFYCIAGDIEGIQEELNMDKDILNREVDGGRGEYGQPWCTWLFPLNIALAKEKWAAAEYMIKTDTIDSSVQNIHAGPYLHDLVKKEFTLINSVQPNFVVKLLPIHWGGKTEASQKELTSLEPSIGKIENIAGLLKLHSKNGNFNIDIIDKETKRTPLALYFYRIGKKQQLQTKRTMLYWLILNGASLKKAAQGSPDTFIERLIKSEKYNFEEKQGILIRIKLAQGLSLERQRNSKLALLIWPITKFEKKHNIRIPKPLKQIIVAFLRPKLNLEINELIDELVEVYEPAYRHCIDHINEPIGDLLDQVNINYWEAYRN